MTAACRRDKAKVLMPENANIPLDDEDILDLTVVAEPGSQQTAPLDGPPEPGDPDADFGVDLDALLDSMGADAATPSPAPATPAVPESPASPVAAPIADQTPVDHKVDPDEEMALPEMSDIDSLLAELGAASPDAPPQAESAADEEMPPVAAEPAPSVPMAEFDGILAQARAAEAQKAEEEKAALAAAVAAPKPVAAPLGAPDADDGEDLDLNELDALLDDILAAAPEMSVPASEPPATAPTAAPDLEAAAETQFPDEAASSPLPADAAVIPVPDQALMPALAVDPAALSALESRLQKLEESVDILETEEIPEAMIDGLIDAKLGAKIEEILAENSPFIARIVKEIRAQIAEGTLEFSEQFTVNMEKMAAAAAAKVIREEIAGVLQEMEGGQE